LVSPIPCSTVRVSWEGGGTFSDVNEVEVGLSLQPDSNPNRRQHKISQGWVKENREGNFKGKDGSMIARKQDLPS